MRAFIFALIIGSSLARVIQDDLPPEPACEITNDDELMGKIGTYGAITDPEDLWPGGILYYTLRDGEFDQEQIDKIEYGVSDLMNSVKVDNDLCIQILPRTDEENYVELYNGGGCSSYVGMYGHGAQGLSLADGCFRHGTVMHEFIHALGFHHEHSRPDRDDFVEIMWDNISEGKEGNFRKYNATTGQCFDITYDYDSVMHYSATSFSDNGEPTINPFDIYAVIGQRVHLTTKDIEGLQMLYGCKTAAETQSFREAVGDCPGNQLP